MTWLDESLTNSLAYFKKGLCHKDISSILSRSHYFSAFSRPSVQSVETDDRKQFQHLNIGLNNNKFDHYFWNSIDARTRFSK